MRGPIIGSRLCSEKDAAFELDHFSRDPQWVLEWMAVKAAAYHKEAEKRECRARKKPEKAEAAGGHVTGRIKDMMIVRGRTISRMILRSLCEGTCQSCVGGGLLCSKMRRTLSIASWRR